MLEFIISPNLLHAGKPAIWYLSAYDAPRRRNIFRAVDSPSCRGNLFDYEDKTYIKIMSVMQLYVSFLQQRTESYYQLGSTLNFRFL